MFRQETPVADVLYVLMVVAFCALMVGFVYAYGRLIDPQECADTGRDGADTDTVPPVQRADTTSFEEVLASRTTTTWSA
jgi:hypothetical protein